MEAIQEFYIGFTQEFDDEVLSALKDKIEYSPQIEKLSLIKGFKFTSISLQSLFEVQINSLKAIKFDQCELLGNDAVIAIANSCKNLEKLSLQWCLQVGDQAIEKVLLQCLILRKLDCTGMKNLKDGCLLKVILLESQGQPTALRSLNRLSFNRCDYVSNKLLEACYAKFGPKLKIHDFYNELIE